jgi:hypothetical protein
LRRSLFLCAGGFDIRLDVMILPRLTDLILKHRDGDIRIATVELADEDYAELAREIPADRQLPNRLQILGVDVRRLPSSVNTVAKIAISKNSLFANSDKGILSEETRHKMALAQQARRARERALRLAA